MVGQVKPTQSMERVELADSLHTTVPVDRALYSRVDEKQSMTTERGIVVIAMRIS